jgi:hypothetical protein
VVALALLFTMAAGAVSQLRFTSHAANAQKARDLADAAVETAIARLRHDLSFGQVSGLLPGMPAAEIKVQQGPAQGLLSFHPGKALDLGIPVSLNNVDSDAALEGWGGRVIPPEAAQLVAVGTCGDTSRTVEVVVHVPRFPYVVSSSGSFSSEGPLVLGVLPEDGDPAQFDPDDLLPGHLASNDAVDLRGEAVISGDVEAVSDISIADPAQVRGLVRPNSSPVPLAKIRITDYEPNPAVTDSFSGSSGPAELSGFYQGSGQVMVNGGLDLEGAVLYVDGDLHVSNGGIKGKGAVISTGSITVDGTTSLESDQQVALLSHGDVTLNGHGAFRGVVYTEGDLHSTGVELIGALIANSTDGGAIDLHDSGAVAGEPSMKFDEGWLYEPLDKTVSIPWQASLGPPDMAQVRRSGHVEQQGDQYVVDWTFEWASPAYDPADFHSVLGEPPPDPSGFLASLGPLPAVREVYDRDGHRVSSNYDEVYGPFWEHLQQLFDAEVERRLAEIADYGLRDHREVVEGIPFTPPVLTPTRVRSDPVLQTFKLDFNQFLKAEENLRLLLRVEH